MISENQTLIDTLCKRCGQCCINKNDHKWIEVTLDDAIIIPEEFLQTGDIEQFSMIQNPNGRCIALDENNLCTIYKYRGQNHLQTSATKFQTLCQQFIKISRKHIFLRT